MAPIPGKCLLCEPTVGTPTAYALWRHNLALQCHSLDTSLVEFRFPLRLAAFLRPAGLTDRTLTSSLLSGRDLQIGLCSVVVCSQRLAGQDKIRFFTKKAWKSLSLFDLATHWGAKMVSRAAAMLEFGTGLLVCFFARGSQRHQSLMTTRLSRYIGFVSVASFKVSGGRQSLIRMQLLLRDFRRYVRQ